MKERDRYLKLVEWSEEDQCYVGSIPGWIGKCCHGEDEEQVYHQLGVILDEWIQTFNQDGRPLPPGSVGRQYSGKFQLRLGEELHQALVIRALQEGESLNSLCAKILRKGISTPVKAGRS